MNAPTRRAAFGVLAGVPALSLPAFAAVLADPVYTAMERHRRAYDTADGRMGRRHGAAWTSRTRPISAAGMTSGRPRRTPSKPCWRRSRRRGPAPSPASSMSPISAL